MSTDKAVPAYTEGVNRIWTLRSPKLRKNDPDPIRGAGIAVIHSQDCMEARLGKPWKALQLMSFIFSGFPPSCR